MAVVGKAWSIVRSHVVAAPPLRKIPPLPARRIEGSLRRSTFQGGVGMADSSQGIARIGGTERIASLDVLRGIAILFILFMNIPWMAYYAPSIGDPRLVSWTPFDQGAFGFMIL